MSTFSMSAKNKRSLSEVNTNIAKNKKKKDEAHLNSCRDASCTGCAEGEVELVFTKLDGGESGANEPTAAQFYQFALEESNRSGVMTPVARKLFERAIESFREEERVYSSMDHRESTSTDEEAASVDRVNHQLLYASCQLTFAQQLSLADKVHETISKLKALTKYNNTSVWLHLGRAQLIAIGMELERLDRTRVVDDNDSEDEDDDNNTTDVEPIMIQLNEAISAFDMVISDIKRNATLTNEEETNKSVSMLEMVRLLTAIQTLIEATPVASCYQGN
ncbi:hypothetical protein BDF22DRAFT_73076 [Syncephalis plumigaleata]|nr:hypothetical protein BDF22DRAFT_73076 [Syncephalis plumigaleata]